jgi:hypothetical protein
MQERTAGLSQIEIVITLFIEELITDIPQNDITNF